MRDAQSSDKAWILGYSLPGKKPSSWETGLADPTNSANLFCLICVASTNCSIYCKALGVL